MAFHDEIKHGPKTYKRPKTILKHVRDYFDRNPRNFKRGGRWGRRAGADDGYARCALGALDYFAADQESFEKALDLLLPHTGRKQHGFWPGIVAVNDRKGRKAVIAAIDKALAS